jgi:hypothetical protein
MERIETMADTTDRALLVSEAWWATPSSARYMAQLCKHFAHKIAVTLNERDGRMVFAFGTCDAIAEETGLRLRASAPGEDELHQLEDVIIRHLQRFAFRDLTEEAAAAIHWVRH